MEDKSLEFESSKSKLETKLEKLRKENTELRETISEMKCKLGIQSKMIKDSSNNQTGDSCSKNESLRKDEQIRMLTKQLEMAKEIIKDRDTTIDNNKKLVMKLTFDKAETASFKVENGEYVEIDAEEDAKTN